MNEKRGPSMFDAMVDRQAEATRWLFLLAFLGVAALLVAFGAHDVETAEGAAADSAAASLGDHEPYVRDHEEPHAYLAARAARIAAAEPIAGVFLPLKPYADLAARAAGIEAAEPVAGVFLPFQRESAFEPCC